MGRTHLHAQVATVAKRRIDERLAPVFRTRTLCFEIEPDSGTADRGDALFAARALLDVDHDRLARLRQLDAWRFEDDGRWTLIGDGGFCGNYRSILVEWVCVENTCETVRVENALYGQRLVFRSHEGLARAGVWLRARHSRRGVVEHHDCDVVPVVCRIGQAGHAACEERRVAHAGNCLLTWVNRRKTLRHGYARAHAQACVDRLERFGIAKRIASDVSAHDCRRPAEGLFDGVEASPVRTARAEHGRPHRKFVVEIDGSNVIVTLAQLETETAQATSQPQEFLDAHDDVVDIVLATVPRFARQFAVHVEGCVGASREPNELVFDDIVELFDDEDVAQAFSK